MQKLLETVNGLVWGVPALLAILGVGLYLTFRTGFAQFRLFPKALAGFLRQFSEKNDHTDRSPFRALCTALAATVGTGNLAGVAGAIAIGGPGAIFWMWVCALIGMITKFAEATLAVRFRKKDSSGAYSGGPMLMIEQGLGKRWKWLAKTYCFFAVIASFGVGNATQTNAIICGINRVSCYFGGKETLTGNLIIGVILAVFVCAAFWGGGKKIGQLAERLVPFASLCYLLLGGMVLIGRAQEIPGAFSQIIVGAFSPRSVTGGVVGSCVVALRVGTSRGVFTNEAGMGTASIAHAGAEVAHPVEQGMMGIIEVFIDTIVICTITALVILCSGVPVVYGLDQGMELTNRAFSAVVGDWVCIPLALSLCCFGFATVMGWGLYGVKCAQYLFGEGVWKMFIPAQCAGVILSSVLGTATIWMIAETVNGLMAIPNLIVLAALSPELCRLIYDYRYHFPEIMEKWSTYAGRNLDKSTVKVVK